MNEGGYVPIKYFLQSSYVTIDNIQCLHRIPLSVVVGEVRVHFEGHTWSVPSGALAHALCYCLLLSPICGCDCRITKRR